MQTFQLSKANDSPFLFKFITGIQQEISDFLENVCNYAMLIYISFTDYWVEAIFFAPSSTYEH